MRIIVYGLGAIGGTVAAALAHAGQDVIGIARERHQNAISKRGLRLIAPGRRITGHLPVVGTPSEIEFRPDDAVLLTMKSQDTQAALSDLTRAGVKDQPIFCFQNGVANERMAAERFAHVHGVTVMLPARLTQSGRVATFVEPRFGLFDLGRYPNGTDEADQALAEALETANFAAYPQDDVMASKYGKLLMNLGNVLQAAVGPKAKSGPLRSQIEDEAKAVYTEAGITWADVGKNDPRRDALVKFKKPFLVRYVGGSTTQSLGRGGSLETNYLNGEIVQLAKAHGMAAPLNAGLVRLGQHLSDTQARPGCMSVAQVEAFLAEG